MRYILALILVIYMPYLLSSGFADTTRNTPRWHDGNGTRYDQPNTYAASDPLPYCPQSGIYLKNNSPRQESFNVTLTDNSQRMLSILPNNSACIHTSAARKILSITVFPFFSKKQISRNNGTKNLMSTGFNGSGDKFTDSYQPTTARTLPPPPLSTKQIQQFTKKFTQFFKNTIYYSIGQASRICRIPPPYNQPGTLTYDGHSLQCWKTTPTLSPWYAETKPIIIGHKHKN